MFEVDASKRIEGKSNRRPLSRQAPLYCELDAIVRMVFVFDAYVNTLSINYGTHVNDQRTIPT